MVRGTCCYSNKYPNNCSVPALLSIAICPAMCIGIGGIMWFMSRFSKKKNKAIRTSENEIVKTQEKEFGHSCCENQKN